MITIDGEIINDLYEAYLWLKEAWIYESYDIYYDEKSDCIEIEPSRDNYDSFGYTIYSIEEFEKFINNH